MDEHKSFTLVCIHQKWKRSKEKQQVFLQELQKLEKLASKLVIVKIPENNIHPIEPIAHSAQALQTADSVSPKLNKPCAVPSDMQHKGQVIDQCDRQLDKSLLVNSVKRLDLDEKIMLGLRTKEGINLKNLFIEEGWDENNSKKFMSKLLTSWQKYRDYDLLLNEGDRFFLSDPEGMELSNQIIIDMFNWWDQIN